MTKNSQQQLTATVEHRIPFHDVDSARLVWHGHYFKYFELARCALLDKLDYGYRQMEASGFVWPIVDLKTRFILPLRYEQVVNIEARLVEWTYRLRISYRIQDLEQRLAARAVSDQAPVVEKTGEMLIGCPDALTARVERTLALLERESADR